MHREKGVYVNEKKREGREEEVEAEGEEEEEEVIICTMGCFV